MQASKQSLVGAIYELGSISGDYRLVIKPIYEQEKEETETRSVPGDLKKYLNSRSLTRQVCNFSHFTFLFTIV